MSARLNLVNLVKGSKKGTKKGSEKGRGKGKEKRAGVTRICVTATVPKVTRMSRRVIYTGGWQGAGMLARCDWL